jgi:hypothetical protein
MEAPKGTLSRFHPDITDVVDVSSTSDQMKIFDTLAATDVTVIDVRAGLLGTTLRMLRDIGFLETAKKNQIAFAMFHILGPSIASLDEIAETATFMNDANYFLVKNFINNTTFFEWDPATYNSYFNKIKGAQESPFRNSMKWPAKQVELASVSSSFVANKIVGGVPASYSFVLRGYVRHWLGTVWAEFDRAKVMDIVTPEVQRKVATR